MPSCSLLIMGNWEIKQIYQQSWSSYYWYRYNKATPKKKDEAIRFRCILSSFAKETAIDLSIIDIIYI